MFGFAPEDTADTLTPVAAALTAWQGRWRAAADQLSQQQVHRAGSAKGSAKGSANGSASGSGPGSAPGLSAGAEWAALRCEARRVLSSSLDEVLAALGVSALEARALGLL